MPDPLSRKPSAGGTARRAGAATDQKRTFGATVRPPSLGHSSSRVLIAPPRSPDRRGSVPSGRTGHSRGAHGQSVGGGSRSMS